MRPISGTIGNRDGIGGLDWCKEGMVCFEFNRSGWCWFPKQRGLSTSKVGCPVFTFRRDILNLYPVSKLRYKIAIRLSQLKKEIGRYGLVIQYWFKYRLWSS